VDICGVNLSRQDPMKKSKEISGHIEIREIENGVASTLCRGSSLRNLVEFFLCTLALRIGLRASMTDVYSIEEESGQLMKLKGVETSTHLYASLIYVKKNASATTNAIYLASSSCIPAIYLHLALPSTL
jgi:hypothetical protein